MDKKEEMKNNEVIMDEKEESLKEKEEKEIKEVKNKKEQEAEESKKEEKIEIKEEDNKEETKSKEKNSKEDKNQKSSTKEQENNKEEQEKEEKIEDNKEEPKIESKAPNSEDKKEVESKELTKKDQEKEKRTEEKPEIKRKIEDNKNEVKQEETKKEVKKVNVVRNEKQKSQNNKVNNKKSGSKKIVIAIITVIAIIAISYGTYFIILNSLKTSAINEIDNVFTAFKSGDEEIFKKYLGTEEMTENLNDGNSKEMTKAMLSHLEYEIISINTNFKESEIKLNVSNKDLKKVFENYMKKAFSIAISQAFGKISEEDSNSQLLKTFQEQYESESIETIKSEISIKLIREKGKWKINADEKEVLNAILPGYESVLEAIK